MKKIVFILKVIFFTTAFFMQSIICCAQVGNTLAWTWMKGDVTTNNLGIYGTQGVAAAANKPGGREGFVSWTDASGNLWLFGGGGEASASSGVLNDLWKYDLATNMWTWMKGDNTPNVAGVYGTQGVANTANKPGARSLSTSWTDASGNLWLFGGSSYDDLWKYDVGTNMWTWVSGDNTTGNVGVYGTKGVTAATNRPGMKNRTAIPDGKADASGNLWLFGGYGYANTTIYGDMNDLWKYNIATNMWTWMGGDNTISGPGVYGTMGVGATTNKPAARVGGAMWLDTAGKVWLYGGGSDLSNWNPKYSDLWKYDPVTNEWTWVKGDNTPNNYGIYGTQGVASSSNNPGGRLMQANWIDNYGNFWLFGGYGFCITGSGNATGTQGLNDVWKYDPLTNNWTWMKGDNTADVPGVYGTQGVAATTNKPGERSGGVNWKDNYGNLWQFAGLEWNIPTAWKSDLWKLVIPQPVAKGNLASCQALPAITIDATNNNTWVPVYDNVGNIAAEINANGNNPGTVNISLFTRNGACREDAFYRLYLNRNITITPQNQPASGNVSVRFFLLKSELDSLRLAYNSQGQPSGVASINEIDGFKNDDACAVTGSNNALPLTATTGSYGTDFYLQVNVTSFSSFYFANKLLTAILPVKITGFTGTRNGKVNVLKWQAGCAGAINFTIERSNNDIDFKAIGTITGNNCSLPFEFTDQQPAAGRNYYRVRSGDITGPGSYSPVILLQDDQNKDILITTLPGVVTSNSIHVQVSAAHAGAINFIVMDLVGRLVARQQVNVQEGSSLISLETGMLAPGIYGVYGIGKTGRTNVIKFIHQ